MSEFLLSVFTHNPSMFVISAITVKTLDTFNSSFTKTAQSMQKLNELLIILIREFRFKRCPQFKSANNAINLVRSPKVFQQEFIIGPLNTIGNL